MMRTGPAWRVLAAGLAAAGMSVASAADFAYVPPEMPAISGKAPADAGAAFLAGVNYPWNRYGGDFGANAWGHNGVSAPASKAVVAADFAFLRSKGVKTVRWFLFCDGRAGLKYDHDGLVTGLDDKVMADLGAALAIAQANGVKLILSLFDFKLLGPAEVVNGVQLGGRSQLVADAQASESLFKNAIGPVLAKYGSHPAILAWEVMNEPELGMKGALKFGKNRTVTRVQLHAFAKRVVSAVHGAKGLATLGSYRRSEMAQWKGLGLDLYQYHYYDYMEYSDRLDVPYASLGLDKPCILGEFPTKKTKRSIDAYLDLLKRNGFAGALGWSYRGGDESSDFKSVADRFAAWVNGR